MRAAITSSLIFQYFIFHLGFLTTGFEMALALVLHPYFSFGILCPSFLISVGIDGFDHLLILADLRVVNNS